MLTFEIHLRLYDRGVVDAMPRYRLLIFTKDEGTYTWETYGNSIAETIFNAGYDLVRSLANGLNNGKKA